MKHICLDISRGSRNWVFFLKGTVTCAFFGYKFRLGLVFKQARKPSDTTRRQFGLIYGCFIRGIISHFQEYHALYRPIYYTICQKFILSVIIICRIQSLVVPPVQQIFSHIKWEKTDLHQQVKHVNLTLSLKAPWLTVILVRCTRVLAPW